MLGVVAFDAKRAWLSMTDYKEGAVAFGSPRGICIRVRKVVFDIMAASPSPQAGEE